MENLKKLRKKHQLTQIGLQMKTGINQSILSKYENNERLPTCENLMILAKFYRTSLDYLMDMTDDPKPYPPKKQ
ncbi:MAG: helix-turn-helix domain-containing protein [Oscillospiraceae bacterium]